MQILRTEFPSYDLLASFAVLSIGGKRNVDSERDDEHFEKLAKFCHVDPSVLKAEFSQIYLIASRIANDEKCTVKEAWRKTVQQIKARKSMEGSLSALLPVLIKHATYGASTSGVEQTFSRFKRTFGEHRLGGNELTELDVMKLVFDRNPAEEQDVIRLAREHWVQEFGMARRTPAEERIDAGRPRKMKIDGTTEVSMIKRRRSDVSKLVDGYDTDELAEVSIEDLDGWTARHEKEMQFQLKKNLKRKVQAYEEGVLTNGELDADIQADVQKKRDADEKNRKIRVATATRASAKLASIALSKQEMRGMAVFIDVAVKVQALLQRAEQLRLKVVADRMEARSVILFVNQ